nr:hypothetical protein [Tanacetum cinerariifolium]
MISGEDKIDMFKSCCTGEDLGTYTKSQPTPSPTQPSAGDQPSLTESSSKHDSSQDPRVDLEGTCGSEGDQVNLPHDSPLSGGHTFDRAEGSLNLEVLYALYTNLSNRILALETVKDAQAEEILTLKAIIKTLEKRCKPSISHHRAWLRNVYFLSKKKKLSKRKSVSKQGRKNAKAGPTKDGNDKLDAELDERALNEGRKSTVDTVRLDVSTARLDVSTARPDVSTARPDVSTARLDVSTARLDVSTARPDVSTARPDVSTARLDVSTARQELSTADILIKLKDDKSKVVAFRDSESTYRPARSILTLKPLVKINPKDKRKGVLEEHESAKKMTKSDFDAAQIARDKEIARQLKVELQAEVERERQREEQASMDYIENLNDEVQARIDADQEFTHSQLNKKSFEDIQGLYIKEHELIVDFVPIGSEEDERMIRDMNKKAKEESSNKDVDNTKKRKKGSRMKRMSKSQKIDVDLEEEEKLKTFMKIDPDEEEVIDYEVLDKRFLIIN